MRSATTFLALLFGLVMFALTIAPAAHAGGKEEALAKIRTAMDAGHLDEAKHMIDHLLSRNPGDKDLLALLETWRVRKGQLGPILDEEGLGKPENFPRLRELCFEVVAATMGGNPEEWAGLRDLGEEDATRVTGLLEARLGAGSEEDRTTARALLEPEEPGPPSAATPDELVARIRAGRGPAIDALRIGEETRVRKLTPFAEKVFESAGSDFELRFAAAGCLLALGKDTPRKELRASLRAARAVEAAAALEVLLRHPGDGEAALLDLYREIEADEEILRAKPALLSMTIEAIGDSGRPRSREFLTGLLDSPDHRVDAARALGALHDVGAVEALIAYLRAPPANPESTVGGGLGFLGGTGPGKEAVAAAETVRPALVGAIAILRATAHRPPR